MSTDSVANTPAPVPKKGWGSFHSERDDERVEVLMAKSEADYTPPKMPFVIDWSKKYPLPGPEAAPATETSPEIVPFGAKTRAALYRLDPSWTFLNHGAFGAALAPAVDTARQWCDRMESQPLRFVDRELLPQLVYATRETAKDINAPPKDVVLLDNVTTGLNTIFRSLGLKKGERIVTLDLGYGATDKMLKHVCADSGAIHDKVHIPLPVPSAQMIVGALKRYLLRYGSTSAPTSIPSTPASCSGTGEGTGESAPASPNAGVRLVVLDYANSNSGVTLPLPALVAACKKAGVAVLVDAAHAWGSLTIDIAALQPTYLVANGHKWLCAPKGCALMYVSPEEQGSIVPLNISHGHGGGFTSSFVWTGLRDYGPWLSLPPLLQFWRRAGAPAREYMRNTLLTGAKMLAEAWNTELIAPEALLGPMAGVRVPGPRVPKSGHEHTDLQDALHFMYGIEVPVRMLQNRLWVRVSAHIYSEPAEFERLRDALLELRPALSVEEDAADAAAAEAAEEVKPESGC